MKIAILGAGRMGSWFIGQLSSAHELMAYDPAITVAGSEHLTIANALSEIGAWAPELVINASPLDKTIEVFKEVTGFLPPSCLLCDIASVKSGIAEYYEVSQQRFVSIHPNFGPAGFNADALKEENVIIISESEASGKQFFTAFFNGLGVRVFELSFEEFDPMMAYSLCVPGAASLVFGSCVDKKAVPSATFSKHLAIVSYLLSQNDHFLAEVMFNPHCLAQLDKMTAKLEFVKHIIRAKDFSEMQKLISYLRRNVFKDVPKS